MLQQKKVTTANNIRLFGKPIDTCRTSQKSDGIVCFLLMRPPGPMLLASRVAPSWCFHFMQQNQLAIRARTTAQQLQFIHDGEISRHRPVKMGTSGARPGAQLSQRSVHKKALQTPLRSSGQEFRTTQPVKVDPQSSLDGLHGEPTNTASTKPQCSAKKSEKTLTIRTTGHEKEPLHNCSRLLRRRHKAASHAEL